MVGCRVLHCRCLDSARQLRSGTGRKERTVLENASIAKPGQNATTATAQGPAQASYGYHCAGCAVRSCASSSVTICSHGSSTSSPSSSSQSQSSILCRVRSSSSGSAEGHEAGLSPCPCPAERSLSSTDGSGRQALQHLKASEPALQQTSHIAAEFATPEGDWLDLTGQDPEVSFVILHVCTTAPDVVHLPTCQGHMPV